MNRASWRSLPSFLCATCGENLWAHVTRIDLAAKKAVTFTVGPCPSLPRKPSPRQVRGDK